MRSTPLLNRKLIFKLIHRLALCLSAITITAQTPTFAWASEGAVGRRSGGAFASAHMVTDNAGNSYVSGTFYTGYIVFGNDTLYNMGSNNNLYVVKYDPQGDELWALQSDSFERSGGLALAINAKTGKLYIVANFQENYNSFSVYVPGYFGPYGTTATSGSFVAQIDAATGTVDWLKEMDSHINVSCITADGDSIVIGGIFKNTTGSYPNYVYTPVPFGNGISLTGKSNYGLYDIFLAECDSSGNTLWARQAYQPSGGSAEGGSMQSVTTDYNGNILALGIYQGSLVIGADSLVSAGIWMYTAKFDHSGNFIWAVSNGSVPVGGGTGYNSGTKRGM